jgi:NAD(P)-dependent dehydrogenase (short-subunit alcohol dehydrogenase family)
VWRTADPIIGVVLDRFGRLDIPVNNAGCPSPNRSDCTTVGVNLAGFFWLTQRAIAEMVSRYGGHVVNVSATIAEIANSEPRPWCWPLTKGGLAAATRSLAVGYASGGIFVNAWHPAGFPRSAGSAR